jgi:hypothetical protein
MVSNKSFGVLPMGARRSAHGARRKLKEMSLMHLNGHMIISIRGRRVRRPCALRRVPYTVLISLLPFLLQPS